MQDKIIIIVLNNKEEVINQMEWTDMNSAKAFLFDLMIEGQKTGQFEVETSSIPDVYFLFNFEV